MTPDRYSRSAIALHWAIAVLLLFQLGLGWHMTNMPKSGTMFAAFQFHKSIGILILALSIVRVAIRFVKPRPDAVPANRFTSLLAKLVHVGLYVLMIGGPITGWAVVSTAELAIPTRLFGAIPLPHLPIGRTWHETAERGHWAFAWLGIGLILLHVAGAIRHHLPDRGQGRPVNGNVIGRMIPFADNRMLDRRKILFAIVAVLVLAGAFLIPWLWYSGTVAISGASPGRTAPPKMDDQATPAPAPEAAPAQLASDEPSASPSPSTASMPVAWKVEKGGILGFSASMNGAAINGHFADWSADILFDPESLDGSRIVVRVPLLSASTADADRDQMLSGPNFFGNAGGTAIFRASKFQKTSGHGYSASGTLTMNGKSRPVRLMFSLDIDHDIATVSGSSELDRTAFGIGTGDWAATDQIAARVGISFKFKARRVK